MKRLILRLLSTFLAGFVLIACGQSDSGGTQDKPSPVVAFVTPVAPSQTVDPNLIKVGYAADAPPFVTKEADGQPAGFDIDLINAIAGQEGLRLEFVEVKDFRTIFGSMAETNFTGFEVAVSAITITPQRLEQVDFSQPYFNTGQAIVINPGSPITGVVDLSGRPVGVQEGTTGDIWCRENKTATCTPFRDISLAFKALDQNEVEAVVYDKLVALNFVSQYPDLVLLDPLATDELYGIAVHKSRPELLERLNHGLQAVMQSGQYEQLCLTWFGSTQACLPVSPGAPATSSASATEVNQPTPTPEESTATVETATITPVETLPPPSPPLLSCHVPPPLTSTPGRVYRIAAGDWLSRIAEREYGNALDYRAIVSYNNERCTTDPGLTCLENPDRIGVDWQIYLPSPEEVSHYWSGQLVTLPPIDWQVQGEIKVTGSSTVYLLTRQLAACFQEGGFQGEVKVESSGTLAGFEQLCAGQADIADASEPMAETYQALCRNNGRTPLALQIGTDALSIVVSHQNDFVRVDNLTPEELKQILATATTWAEVRPEWPEQPIHRFYPTESSGTFDSLVHLLFEDNPAPLLSAANILLQSEDDTELVRAIENDPFAVGFLGFAYYKNNQETLYALPVRGVRPLPESVDQGTYPLIRPLYIYTAPEVLQQKPEVAAFVNYYLQSVKDYIIEVGYFLPGEAALQQAVQSFNEAIE